MRFVAPPALPLPRRLLLQQLFLDVVPAQQREEDPKRCGRRLSSLLLQLLPRYDGGLLVLKPHGEKLPTRPRTGFRNRRCSSHSRGGRRLLLGHRRALTTTHCRSAMDARILCWARSCGGSAVPRHKNGSGGGGGVGDVVCSARTDCNCPRSAGDIGGDKGGQKQREASP